MALKHFLLALSAIAAATSPLAALPAPMHEPGRPRSPATARYCLRMEPITGTRIETIRCLRPAKSGRSWRSMSTRSGLKTASASSSKRSCGRPSGSRRAATLRAILTRIV